MTMLLRDKHKEWLADPQYSEAYNALEQEFATARMLIIARAKANLTRYTAKIPHKNPHEGETWASMRARLFTPEELAASKERVKIILKKADERDARERLALARQAQVYTSRLQAEVRA